MVKNYSTLNVEEEYKEKLLNDCVKEYLKHHPEMVGIPITASKILKEVVEYYLK